MNRILLLLVALVTLSTTAQAQLTGTDIKPGDPCTAAQEGHVARNASADRNISEITLICDGSQWQSATGGGGSLPSCPFGDSIMSGSSGWLCSSAFVYPSSCKAILDAGNSGGDGNYTIDPDGSGGDAQFQAYCDMTGNGGGWTQIPLATQWQTARLNAMAVTKEVRFTDATGTSFLSWTGTLPTNAQFDSNLCSVAGTRKAGNSYPPSISITAGPYAYTGPSNDYIKPFICWVNHASNAGCNASWGGRSNFHISYLSGSYYSNNCASNGLSAFWIR
ncbi:MAG: fibrinogen-like YCDxxxxGGGW domain-containing protein [Hyphomicrobium sp.]|uniref:fibrinogen-like YCDxxxxGGGW domain-containing protein n=1 Tax=Hyphomicrobium sp. TaxID=82 RepID=UPI0035650290